MTLHLVRIGVNQLALAQYAIERRIGDDDDGYALHCALAARFGDAAPRPFRYWREHARGAHVLGYVADWPAMQDAAALPPADDRLAAVFDTPPQAQPMPTAWRAAARYAFEVRVRPIVRFGKEVRAARGDRAGAWQPKAGEIDAYVAACERAVRDGQSTDTVKRGGVYVQWLARRLDGAATLEDATLRLFQRTRSRRSTHRPGDSGARTHAVEGPDAVVAGTLTITDSAAFADILTRGVGRHAAFGHGMLLLSPAGRAA